MYHYVVTQMATRETAIALLDTNDPNTLAPLALEGAAAPALKVALNRAYGAFGHGFDVERTTAIDLDYALFTLNGWQPESIGDSPVEDYDPGIPEGAVT